MTPPASLGLRWLRPGLAAIFGFAAGDVSGGGLAGVYPGHLGLGHVRLLAGRSRFTPGASGLGGVTGLTPGPPTLAGSWGSPLQQASVGWSGHSLAACISAGLGFPLARGGGVEFYPRRRGLPWRGECGSAVPEPPGRHRAPGACQGGRAPEHSPPPPHPGFFRFPRGLT